MLPRSGTALCWQRPRLCQKYHPGQAGSMKTVFRQLQFIFSLLLNCLSVLPKFLKEEEVER